MAFKYGAKVIIRDGSLLDGTPGVVYSVKDGRVLVLIDREVFWEVSEQWLDPVVVAPAAAAGAPGGFAFGGD